MSLIAGLNKLKPLIGNTPLHRLEEEGFEAYAKLEYMQFCGSIKDRPAFNILWHAVEKGEINEHTTVIESTSGNFGIAVAAICKKIGIKFIAVIDPNVTAEKERILRLFAHQVIKVTERDETGGFLLNRLHVVRNYLADNPNAYHPNQYGNVNNCLAYYGGLGPEIRQQLEFVDFAFVSVSSAGTVTGLSKRLKEDYPNIQVVAVDVEGSTVFQPIAGRRNFSGIGASKRSEFIENADIDEVMILSEDQIVEGCNQLLEKHLIFAGASSGAAYYATTSTLRKYRNSKGIFICPDRGNAYAETVYNPKWVREHIACNEKISVNS